MQINEKYDIIIQGGQSNAEGSGIGPVTQEFSPNSNILYIVRNNSWSGTTICYTGYNGD